MIKKAINILCVLLLISFIFSNTRVSFSRPGSILRTPGKSPDVAPRTIVVGFSAELLNTTDLNYAPAIYGHILNVDGYNAVKALIAQIASVRARSMSYTTRGGGRMSMVHGRILPLGSAAINWYRNAGVNVTQMQHGGMINEPIFGIGKSGQQYSFGEAGKEKVTPMFGDKAKGGGSIGPVNINVNIDSVKDDVDLEKIKPIVERALQEVHARRGII